MPTFIWNIDPEMASTPTSDHSNIFGTNPSICFSCPGPLNSVARGEERLHQGRDPRLRRVGGVEAVRVGNPRRVQAVHERQGAGRVLRRHVAVRGGSDRGRAEHEGQGCPVRQHVHGHERGHQVAAGDAEAGPERDAEPPQRVRPRFRRARTRRCSRATSSSRSTRRGRPIRSRRRRRRTWRRSRRSRTIRSS